MTKQPIKAVLLDRDGTVIEEKPGTYLSDPAQLRLYKSVPGAFKRLKELGFKLFMVSNQSGIGRGYFTAKEVDAVHTRLQKLVRPYCELTEIVYCPHSPDQACACRKPGTLLGEKLIKKYHIDIKQSFMIGDKKADVLFGQKLGLGTILVTTANGKLHLKKYPDLRPDKVATNLRNAVHYIEKLHTEKHE